MCWPVSVSPVKEISGTSGWSTSAAPASSPMPWTMLNTPAGTPGLGRRSPATGDADSGVHSAGLRTTRAAGRQRRGELPALQHERGVPRRDQPGDADRPADHVVELVVALPEGVLAEGHDQVGEEAEVLRGPPRLAPGLGDRQAGVERLEARRGGRRGPRRRRRSGTGSGPAPRLAMRPRTVGEGGPGGRDGPRRRRRAPPAAAWRRRGWTPGRARRTCAPPALSTSSPPMKCRMVRGQVLGGRCSVRSSARAPSCWVRSPPSASSARIRAGRPRWA